MRQESIAVVGSNKDAVECMLGGVLTLEAYSSISGDSFETSGAVLLEAIGNLREADIAYPGSFFGASETA